MPIEPNRSKGPPAANPCPACGGPSIYWLSSTDRNRRLSEQRFHYYRCTSCGTIYLDPVPDNLSDYYPASYYALPETRARLVELSFHERYKLELIRPYHEAPARLCEIGPGSGGFLALAQDAGYDATAIEMDPRVCQYLTDVVGVTSVYRSDQPHQQLLSLPAFDVICLWHVLEHIRNVPEILTAAYRSLRPDGVLVVAVPNPEAWQFGVFGRFWTHLDAPRHLQLVPAHTMSELAQAAGFTTELATSNDPGGIHWNRFGWDFSLARFAGPGVASNLLQHLGAVASVAAAPWDRMPMKGSAYTMVLRKKAVS